MFYCNNCADKNGYPKSFFKSYGSCEICNETAVCNNYKSSLLPERTTLLQGEIDESSKDKPLSQLRDLILKIHHN